MLKSPVLSRDAALRCAAYANRSETANGKFDKRRAWVLADFGAGMREPACSGFAKVPCVLESSICVDEERAGTEEKKRRFANHLPCQVCRKLDVGGLGGGYCALRVYFHCAGQS